MEDKDLLTLLIVFVPGYFSHQIMENMCGGRLLEGSGNAFDNCNNDHECPLFYTCLNCRTCNVQPDYYGTCQLFT